jgi:hypothetical protein
MARNSRHSAARVPAGGASRASQTSPKERLEALTLFAWRWADASKRQYLWLPLIRGGGLEGNVAARVFDALTAQRLFDRD